MTGKEIKRVDIELPDKFIFSVTMQVRLSDVAAGLHIGNHILITYLNEALTLFLKSNGYPDFEIDGSRFLNADLAVAFKSEAFYGDSLRINLAFGPLSEKGCNAYFYITNDNTGKKVAEARMAMFFFDYAKSKTTKVPEKFKAIVEQCSPKQIPDGCKKV